MSIDLPDPDDFGESDEMPHERIEESEHHSLEEWETEESNNGDS